MSSHKADVVVIGGGIVGTALAFELARRGAGRVTLVEREPLLGTGATARCAGGIRAQFSSEINCRISQLAERIYMNFEAEVGLPAEYDRVGYMFLPHGTRPRPFLPSRSGDVAEARDPRRVAHSGRHSPSRARTGNLRRAGRHLLRRRRPGRFGRIHDGLRKTGAAARRTDSHGDPASPACARREDA